MPERFQLRNIPVCPTEEGELEEEAEWIYRQAFSTPPLSRLLLQKILFLVRKFDWLEWSRFVMPHH